MEFTEGCTDRMLVMHRKYAMLAVRSGFSILTSPTFVTATVVKSINRATNCSTFSVKMGEIGKAGPRDGIPIKYESGLAREVPVRYIERGMIWKPLMMSTAEC